MPGRPRYCRTEHKLVGPNFLPVDGAAEAMRSRAKMAPPRFAAILDQIIDDAGVVARPLKTIFLEGDWHKGLVVLIGNAVHASTPHLAQGAGMAIEDGMVLAEELMKAETPERSHPSSCRPH